jgi:archaemetzincin
MKILLQPFGHADRSAIDELKDTLTGVFGCSVEVRGVVEVSEDAFDRVRNQYRASALLSRLKSLRTSEDCKILGIVDVDLYDQQMSYVFGEADGSSSLSLISLCRLRQEYYGLPSDNRLFFGRITKEAVHELGHTFGLGHCVDARCVMHFSHCLADTDWKQMEFCSQCHPKLIR